MNAGFSNLATLKTHLLGADIRTRTTWDTEITALGLGMAALFENHCNRKFLRTVGDVATLPADRCQFLLPRFPVESVSAIAVKTTEADGWVAQTINDFVTTIDLTAGIVNLPEAADAGPWYAQVRFTYTGGYWWEIKEPADAGYPATQPTGSFAVPADLVSLWLLLCKDIWNKRDPLGRGIVEKPDVEVQVEELKLSPLVRQGLRQFIREEWV
jgi:hypothetical protein